MKGPSTISKKHFNWDERMRVSNHFRVLEKKSKSLTCDLPKLEQVAKLVWGASDFSGEQILSCKKEKKIRSVDFDSSK